MAISEVRILSGSGRSRSMSLGLKCSLIWNGGRYIIGG